jgi:hypothetical protein
MAVIKKTSNNKMLMREGKRNLLHCLWECKLAQNPWETSMEVHQKAKNKPSL